MKSIKLLFAAAAALFVCFSGSAAPVGTNDAARAVRAWVRRGGTLGARLGQDVTSVGIHATTNGVKFYSVRTLGGGTVFTSADDALEPILAFTPDDASKAARNPNSPLYALLNRDVIGRTAAQSAIKRPALLAAQPASKWSKLLAEAEQQEQDAASGVKRPALSSVPSVGDLRVPPLVQTKWGQQTDGTGKNCYNYYTPSNYVCGCVATAMAQIMRCHQWPQASRAQVTKTCSVDGIQQSNTSMGGVYDWANMPLDPNGDGLVSMTDVQRQAIGKLCYDAGVSVRMDWAVDGSAAYSALVGEAFRDVFGYGSAYSSEGSQDDPADTELAKKVLPNLGAGYPVLFGISYHDYRGFCNGHAIVGDGYGYNDSSLYVHLNMGWYGTDDVWYQLPNMGSTPERYISFNCLNDVVYNIIPDGDDSKAVLSGRVTLPTGAPASGAAVAIHESGSETPLTNVTANAYGVYGAVLPSGKTYEVRATSSGLSGTQTMSDVLPVPTLTDYDFQGYVGTNIVNFSTTKYVKKSAVTGNAMMSDIQLNGTQSGDPLSWTESTALAATQYAAYNHAFAVTGGDTPYAWSAPKAYVQNDEDESTYDSERGTAPFTWQDFDGAGVQIDLGFEFPFGENLHSSVVLTQNGLTLGSDEILSCGALGEDIRVELTDDSFTVDFNGEAYTLHEDGTITVSFASETESATPRLNVFGKTFVFPVEKVGGSMNDITLVRQGLPIGLSLNGLTGVLSGSPALVGDQAFDVIVTDPYGLALTNTFILAVAASANRKPVIESIEGRPASGSMYLKSGVNQTFTVHATDPDGDNMTLRMYVNGKLRALASDVPSGALALFYFSHELTGAYEDVRSQTIKITVSDSTWPEKVSSSWEMKIFNDWYVNAETVEPEEDRDGSADHPFASVWDFTAGDGDTVYMMGGVYDSVEVSSDISIRYEAVDSENGPIVAGIRAVGYYDDTVYTNCIFSGLTVVGGDQGVYGGTLVNCAIMNVTSNEYEEAKGAVRNSTLINCLVAGNTNGAAAVVSSTLYNCTVADNGGSGLDVDSTAYNSIFWGNGDGNVAEGATLVSCCTDGDPLFADTVHGDYRLTEGSPCLDTGNNAYVPEGVTNDLAGVARIQNGIVDKGAFEGVASDPPEPEPVPPGGDVDVPSGYESATDFAEALNDGTADKADYLKAPGGVTTTTEYLSYFSAVPSGDATVAFVLNDDGTNAVDTATEVAATNALAVVLSSSSTLTIADPLVGFYYSLKQGGAVTNLLFNAEGDRNKLGGRDTISFGLTKPEGAGFYQTLITPSEYAE